MYVLTRVWDAPTRMCHWAIVLLIVASWLTQHEGWMPQHVLCGYLMATLLIFRLIWGFVGSDTARFTRFLKSPLRCGSTPRPGLAARTRPSNRPQCRRGLDGACLLGLLCVQVATGLCANDEVSVQGPLAETVGSAASDWLSHIHAVNFRLIEAAILLHVLAILSYRVLRGHRLVGPMISGNKPLPDTLLPPRMAGPARAIAAFSVAAGVVAFVVLWFGG